MKPCDVKRATTATKTTKMTDDMRVGEYMRDHDCNG